MASNLPYAWKRFAKNNAMTHVTPAGRMQAKQKYRLLCVDDNEFGLFVNTTILRNEGYDVLACSDAVKAAAAANCEKLDVAILDYDMPVMNGAELASVCKAANPDIKVIMYSGNVEMPKLAVAFADLFIHKADGVGVLLEGIAALLQTDATPAAVAPITTDG